MTDEILLDKIIGEKIRSYEVSIWTLQDSFITVLKWADLENKGQIQEPKMVLDIDGTQEFTFTIPMYLMSITNEYDVDFQTTRTFEDRVENPIWYNTNNGNLMVSLRKIKVILNKKTDDEKVYEFMITKVEERHENGELFCDVSCEGLTFHELGKVGFKLTLNNDEYEYDYKQWEEKTVGAGKDFTTQAAKDAAKPRENLQYWCDKFLTPLPEGDIANGSLNPSIWYYNVQLRYPFQNETTSTIYDMGHVTAWDSNGIATASVGPREKYRPVDIKESNYYNATQTIAEAFEVYCRYEYIYDDTYHIIGRRVIFYNNFLEEEKGVFDITYPYQTSSITKEMDSTDLVTKLFVKPVDYEYSESGQLDIMSVDANKSREDYILNFDYLHDIGTISDEQYKAIDTYETKMHNINLELESISRKRRAYVYIKDEYDPKLTVAKNAITEAAEEIATAKKELKNLGTGSSSPKFTKDNSKYLIIKKSNKLGYYVNLIEGEKGARASTIKMYDKNPSPTYYVEKTINGQKKKVYDGDQLQFTISYDKFGLVSSLNHIKYGSDVTGKTVNELSGIYLTYTYNPTSYWKGVRRYWEVVHATNTSLKAEYEELLGVKNSNGVWVGNYKGTQNNPDGGINKLIEDCDTAYDAKIEEKNVLIDKFQRMMGPALREGYWQPEDYEDYGDSESFSVNMFTSAGFADSSGSSSDTIRYKYDSNKLTDEEDITFEYGANRTKYRHILIDITEHITDIENWLNNDASRQISDLSFVYCDRTLLGDALEVIRKDGVTTEELAAAQQTIELSRKDLHINGDSCKLACVKLGTNDRKLVLVLTDTSDFLETQVLSNGDIQVSAKGIYNHYNDDLYDLAGKSFSDLLNDGETLPFSDYIIYPRISYVEYDETMTDTWQETVICGSISGGEIKCGYDSSGTSKSSWYSVRFPRLIFNTLKIKTGDTLKLTYNDTILENYSEYQVFTHQDEYYVTLKPSIFIKYYSSNANTLLVNYIISNADDAIYMDAISVEKENAYPKVSYTVELNIFDSDKIKTVYNKLGQIIHINDYELKFKNVQGYISRVEMDLDQPDNDTVEVKNYKTKFEDLFSTIVAQTEAMKKTSFGSSVVAAALNSDGSSLTQQTFSNTLANYQLILNQYIDSGFDSSQVVIDKLTKIFNDAGAILKDANNSLDSVINLNNENATILSGFVSDIRASLTPVIYTGSEPPENFKTGDVWINGDYVGVATSPSISGGGFTRTKDGTLAQIQGAGIAIDAEAGTVDITAKNTITIGSGKDVYIGANEKVDIVGNKSVNIGGTTINIASATTDPNGTGGINIVSTKYDDTNTGVNSTSLSKVLIHPNKIEMGSADIIMRGANKIQMITSRGTFSTTTALSLSPSEGIWIGSGQGVKLFSGSIALTQNSDGTYSPSSGVGASVDLTPDHLLLGVSNTTATAIEMTESQIVIAAGSANKNLDVNGTSDGLIGAKFTKNSIGFATSEAIDDNTTIINAILMNEKGITIGSGTNVNFINMKTNATGSYVRIASSGIEFGTTSDIYFNTNNFKLQTNYAAGIKNNPDKGNTILAIGNNLNNIGADTNPSSLDSNSSVDLLLNNNGLYIKGTVYASAGSFTGAVHASSFELIGEATIDPDDIANLDTRITNNTTVQAVAEPFSHDGLTYGLTWGGINYGVVLSNSSNAKPLLIGSNSGITIAKSATNGDGAAVIIDKNGIDIATGGNFKVSANLNSSNQPRFIINAANTGTNNNLYIANKAVWANATSGIQFNMTNGLEVKGNISATTLSVGSGNNLLTYNSNDGLTIKGNIDAITGSIGGWTISEGRLESGEGTNHVVLIGDSTTNNFFWAGAATYSNSVPFRITREGALYATKGTLGGWTLSKETITVNNNQVECTRLYSGTGTSRVCLSSAGDDYAIWAGAASAASGKFRVKRDGKVYINELMVKDKKKKSPSNSKWEITETTTKEDGKHYDITSETIDDIEYWVGYTPIDFTNTNFNSALNVRLTTSQSGEITATANLWGKFSASSSASITIDSVVVDAGGSGSLHSFDGTAYVIINANGSIPYSEVPATVYYNGNGPGYSEGFSAGQADVGFSTEGLWSGGSKTLTLSNGKSKTVSIPSPASWSAARVGDNLVSVSVQIGGTTFTSTVNA